jgi:allantoin racemase
MTVSKIHILTPIITRGVRSLDDVIPFEREDLKVTHSLLDEGPASIESEFDEALSIPDTIRKAIDAEKAGADAIIIDCMGDPGLNACREVVSIPVLGPCQTAMHVASMLGHRFSFLTVLERLRPMIAHMVAAYGLQENYASFEAVDVPVLDIHQDLGSLSNALSDKAHKAVKQNHAGAIILGCTGFLGCAEAIRAALLKDNIDVPVIDPIPLALHVADALVKTQLSHSKSIYPRPGAKRIVGYDFPGLCL